MDTSYTSWFGTLPDHTLFSVPGHDDDEGEIDDDMGYGAAVDNAQGDRIGRKEVHTHVDASVEYGYQSRRRKSF